MIHKVLFTALVVFYLFAGINHFISPEFYYPLIPDYLGNPEWINTLSGFFEILFALGLVFKKTRSYSVWGILLLLLAFIPAHVHFIQVGGCLSESLCVPQWLAWVRLLIIHPILLLWAWKFRSFVWK